MRRVFFRALALATAGVLGTAGMALADDISVNTSGPNFNSATNTMSLTVGGSDGTTNYYVTAENGDGKPGCNFGGPGNPSVTVSVSSDDTSVATVSPASLVFDSCGDVPTITVHPVGAGSTQIRLEETVRSTTGTFNLAPATFTVAVEESDPCVGVANPDLGLGANPSDPDGNDPWYISTPVVNASSSTAGATIEYATEVDGGPLSAWSADAPVLHDGTTVVHARATTATCGKITDRAKTFYVDTTEPTIAFLSRTPANGNGWNSGDVTASWTCTDSGSGVVNASVSQTVSSEGANQSATGTCADQAGNTASDTQTGVDIDLTKPIISFDGQTPAANANGWNNTAVVLNWSCVDDLSGVDSISSVLEATLSSEGSNQSATGSCADQAGHTDSDTQAGIDIDLTAPAVSLVGGPANGVSYYFGSVPPAPTCNASDALSDLDGPCSLSGYSTAIGTHTVIASASDKAGNSASASATYTVLAWNLNGFYQPVDMDGVFNTVKGGSTVPLKFEVFAGTELTSTSVLKSFVQTKIACQTSATVDEVEITSTGGTSLRYDTTAGQFIQNWQTPKQPGQCYKVTMTTQDGSLLSANFRLK